jgi:nucleotide-binding universal stress UspA family protein
MGLVLCATRGGEESVITQQKAISLAKERAVPLVFLYVADSSFLDKTAAAVVVDVQDELIHMGEFFLVMAVERAVEKGVGAKAVIRAGPFVPTFIEVAHELGATSIVLGRPGGETGRFNEEEFSEFCLYLAEETRAEIITP